jgi:peptide/nickel transport system permease protein
MLLGISLLTFTMFRLAPGDPVALVIDPTLVSAEQTAAVREDLGLNDSFFVQYTKMMTGILDGDLRSFKSKQPTLEVVREAFPVTLIVTLAGLGLAVLTAIPLGVLAANRPNGMADRVVSLGMSVSIAVPTFLVGILLVRLFTEELGWLPGSGIGPPGTVGLSIQESWRYLVMPAVVVALGLSFIFARYMRDALTDVLAEDYIRTARAKGLKTSTVYGRHAVRNALIPILSLLNTILPATLGGSVIIEIVFGLPGLGKVTATAAQTRDYPVVLTTVIFVAVLTLFTNLIVDIVYGVVDPRIRLKEGTS